MKLLSKYFVEFFGTFLLVFFGTGSIIVGEEIGFFDTFSIGVVFGLTVWLVIIALQKYGDVHINPAVTIGFFSNKEMFLKDTIIYILFQIFGGVMASYVLFVIFPSNLKLGNTLPRDIWQEAFVYEFFLSFLLMLVILISTTRKTLQKFAPFLIGFTVFLEAWLAGPLTGASMNPARTLGPSIVSGNVSFLWIYILAPILGMIMANLALKINIKALL
ncbi:MIP/aquaporin family protein [Flavobacterium okayamense]|uniref:Aquaporin n=1 Tax=Flavobacterium okayamense TaxID=2830782 RepID=A0ABM7S6A6_9FLAO|nr:aquaporin [Flavobacterium okayamense]BCY29011.1 hypothetical protein KK2020170_18790 [Flavobacterium okayamense]